MLYVLSVFFVRFNSNGSFINSAVMSLDILDIPDVLQPPIIVTMKHIKVSDGFFNWRR